MSDERRLLKRTAHAAAVEQVDDEVAVLDEGTRTATVARSVSVRSICVPEQLGLRIEYDASVLEGRITPGVIRVSSCQYR